MCDCSKKKFPTVMSTASECGHQTTRGRQMWCTKCALMKKDCPACGEPIEAKKPIDKK